MKNKSSKNKDWKSTKRAGRLFLMYAIVFALLITPLGMVHGASTAIALSRSSGPPGTQIWINGTGFSSNSNVDLYWDSTFITTVTTDANGDFSYEYTIPSSTAGDHTIYATDGSNSASATFTVVPEITLSPNNGYVGTTVRVNGEGFSGNVRVYLFWDSTYLGRTTTNSTGAFTYLFNVPASPYGLHTVKAIDTNENQATASFLVLSHMSLSPTSGYYKEQISYDCTGYSADAKLSIIWDYGTSNAVILDTETTDSSGSYSGSFRIPAAVYGSHNVTGIDEYSHSYTAVFSVTPKVNIVPGTGIVGSIAYVSGHGFSGNSIINISWDTGAILNSTVTNGLGSFSANITIPYAVVGNHIVTANDTNSVQASAVYDITPNIEITPNTGIAGDNSTVNCTGFSGSSSITVYWDFGLPTEVTLSSGTTNSTGTYVASVTIPSGTNTTHTVVGVDVNNYIAQTYYYLGPHIYLSPNSGFVGSNVSVSGTTFAVNSSVKIYWDNVYIASTTTNSTGAFSSVIRVPHAVYGYHVVSAVDATGNQSSADYMVLAHIILSAYGGTVFNNITITGTGFSGDSAAYIYWDSTNTQRSMLTNSTGDFSLSFEIPESTAGAHSIYGKDTNGVTSDTQTYIIYPMVKLHPNYGHIGNSYSIYCYGFGASVTLNMLWDGDSESYSSTTDAMGTGTINAIVPNATAGVHSIEVYDSSLNMAPVVNFTVLPPDSPVAMAPVKYVNTTSPTFSWSSVNYTATYTLEYSTNETFSNSTVITGITTSHYTISGLNDGVTYYWRVLAVDVHGNPGNYSNVLSFTVDITPPSSSSFVGKIYTNNTHILVYYNATDSISGVQKVVLYYSYNGSDYEEYAVSTSAMGVFDFYAPHGDGNYSFYTVAYDRAGNVQAVHSANCYVIVDTVPPTSVINSLPQYIRSRTVNLTFEASDTGSGVAWVNIYWSSDGSTWNYYGAFNTSPVSFSAPHDGQYYFKGVAVDNAGNVQVGTPVIVSTVVDTTPPTVSISLNGTLGDNGWYTSVVYASISATDSTSGVSAIYYAINGEAYKPYNGVITMGDDGVYKIAYYAVDRAGNTAAVQHTVVKIDRTAPSLAVVAPQVNEVLTGNATITVIANDTNIEGVYFKIDEGSWYAMTANGALWKASFDTVEYADGAHTVTVKAVDYAGHSQEHSVNVFFDNVKPEVVGVAIPTGIISGNTKIIIEATDTVGIKDVKCSVSSSGFNQTYKLSEKGTGDYYLELNTTDMKGGTYTLEIVVENYGGKITEISSQFMVDNTPPVVKYTGSRELSGIATLNFNVKDTTSGVKSAWISIDGSSWVPVSVQNGMVKYKWNTGLTDNGVHHIQLKVVDRAGNEIIYGENIYINNLNIWPVIYTVILIGVVISLLLMFRKREETPKMGVKEEKKDDMILPDVEKTNEKRDIESGLVESEVKEGGGLNE